MTRRQLADALGRPYQSVVSRVAALGVTPSAAKSPHSKAARRPKGTGKWHGCDNVCERCPYPDCYKPEHEFTEDDYEQDSELRHALRKLFAESAE